ncbi:MAG TPA: TonB-dependent receptor [Terriglobia bacterium]|nr:TonB-dependent receptor [Terriglobia bacterium]
MSRYFSLLLVSLVLCLIPSAWAQDTANIVGTVMDASGGVIPNAKVVVSNPDKGFTRDLTSNSAGEYTVARIPIGNYVVTAQAKGFQKLVRSGITLEVGQTLRVDLQLTVGAMTQEVTVSGNVARVETENATISDVVTSKQIENLNLNGLNFLSLELLVPGATEDNSNNTTMLGHGGAEPAISFNGNRMEYSNLEIDGGNDSDEGSGAYGGDVTPALDSIAEFRISTSNYGADIGQHSGAVIEVATKAGTKDFHGSAYEFVRNDKMDGNDWFINQTIAPPNGKAPMTPLKWNIFGYTLGGPFYIPGHYNTDKHKTFFFWSEEWARYRTGTVISGNVPSMRMRQGDFSECDPSSPNANPIAISEGCLVPKVNGALTDVLPSINPNAAAMLNGLIPLPNNGFDTYTAAPSLPTNYSEEQIRVDQNISDKATLFVRFTNDGWDQLTAPALWSCCFDTGVTNFDVPARAAVLHLTYSFKPNLMNEFIMGFADDPHTITNKVGPSNVAHSIDKPSSWTGSNFFPANAGNPELPSISICGGTAGCYSEDLSTWVGPYNANPIYTWKDNVAYTVGRHTLKFGMYLEKYQKNEQFGFNTQGYYTFSNSWPGTSGNALADMYLGNINQYEEGTLNFNGQAVGGYGKGHFRRTDFEPYFQDDFKVSRRLTLNLGVRYYLFIPFHDVSRPQNFDSTFIPSYYNPALEDLLQFDPVTGSPVLVANPSTGNVHDFTTFGNGLVNCGHGAILAGCIKPYYGGIGPRFGFAFDPTGRGKTSIRGGYGIYFEPGNGNESNIEGLEGNPPFTLAPSGFNIIGYSNIVPGAYGPPSMSAVPFYQKPPSSQQMNFNVQHDFGGNNLLTMSYVGTLGRHLATARNMNQIPVGITTMNAPALAGFAGVDSLNPSNTTPMCDAAGNCDVQRILENTQQPGIFFNPYRGYSGITNKQNTAVSSYSALQADFRHTTGHGLTFEAAYTWSHMIDDSTTTYFATGVDDDHDLSRWKGSSALNRSQVLGLNYVYNLPFFKNASSALARGALGGWSINGITRFYTGEPVDFGCGVNGFATGIGTGVRCNTVGALKIHKGTVDDPQFGPVPTWFNPSAITQPLASQLPANAEPGMFGYMGRDALTGPGRNNWDLALHKDFKMPWFRNENSTLQVRLDTFNTFNHPQWSSINAGCAGTIPFGQPCTQVGNAEVNGDWGPRNVELGMKLTF